MTCPNKRSVQHRDHPQNISYMLLFSFVLTMGPLAQGCSSTENNIQQNTLNYSTEKPNTTGVLCKATNGRWSDCLRTCDCPGNQLFSTMSGCIQPEHIIQEQKENFYSIGILSTNASLHDLRGITFQDSKMTKDKITISARKSLRPEHIRKELESTFDNPPSERLIRYPPADLREFNIANGMLKCAHLNNHFDQKKISSVYKMCEDLWHALENIIDGTACTNHPLSTIEWGSDHQKTELHYFNAHLGEGTLLYKIEGIPDIPVIRSIRIGNHLDSSLEFLISPLGELFGGRFVTYQMTNRNEQYLVEHDVIYFDGLMNVIDTQRKFSGQRQLLRKASEIIINQNPNSIRLKTDGFRSTLFKPVRGMVIDPDPVNLLASATMSRMELDSNQLKNMAYRNEFQDIFPLDEIHQQWDPFHIVCESNHCEHSTAIISLMTQDLPFSRMTSYSLYNHQISLFHESVFLKTIINKINLEKPKVVNISCGFFPNVQDCKRFSDIIFNRFQEDVLFVISAGNYGEQNPRHICPGSFAHAYVNAISVAGVDEHGCLHPQSNFGSDMIDIAAPYCNQVIHSGKQPGDEYLIRNCGTSFSAPLVANAALRLFAIAPDLKPAEVKQILMNACEDKGLDIACGGQLDLQQLDQIEADLLANQAIHPLDQPPPHPLNELQSQECHQPIHFYGDH